MDNQLQKINTRLQHYNRDELLALIWDFLADRDEEDLADFLDLMRQKSRPAAAAAPELADEMELLGRIKELYVALANDEYVEYGSGYDPDYGEHRGFGDDGWIDEMDSLFASAASLYRAGNYRGAASAYIALFDIFHLNEDGYHFTRPDPPAALQTDLEVMKRQLFTALGMLDPDPEALVPAASEDGEEEGEDRTLLDLSSELYFYGGNRYALLDAWERHSDWMRGLETHLWELCRQPTGQEQQPVFLSHPAELLRELARRAYGLNERETLCRELGPPQGWPYVDLVGAYQNQGQWSQVLTWADDGLAKIPAQSVYRPTLEEARGAALLQLNRPAEALASFQGLFKRKRELPVYLALRAAALATGDWPQLYPELTAAVEQQVLAEVAGRTSGYTVGSLMAAALLGFAHLLEVQIEHAVAWGLRPDIPTGWSDDDLSESVASGLLCMGLAAAGAKPDDVLGTALGGAPRIIREHGELLEQAAQALDPNLLLERAVRLYERLVTRAVDGRNRQSYAVAARYAKVIWAIRKLQGRAGEFERYYQGLLADYPRLSAFKDELRSAIEGPGYKRKR
jgi:hypothetical protein